MGGIPEIRYSDRSGVSIAYCRWGVGDEVVVYTPPWVSNVELMWELEEWARSNEIVGRHLDTVMLDKRGVGLSDRTSDPPSLEDRCADTLAVMDAEGISDAHILGQSEGGAVAIALAARHPERVRSLVLFNAALPGVPVNELASFVEPGDPPSPDRHPIYEVLEHWATAESCFLDYFAPDLAGVPRVENWQRRFERQSASPGNLGAHLASVLATDITSDIDAVKCRTFLFHTRGDQIVPVAGSRWLASRWPNSILRIWDDRNHIAPFSVQWHDMLAEWIEFVTGRRPPPETTSRFAVVLFTDIVDSTKRTGESGNARWATLVRAYDEMSRRVTARHEGETIKNTGDGMLSRFDDPERAIRAAIEMRDESATLGVTIRCGLHAGQVESHPGGDVTGVAVNVAARIESVAPEGQVAVSQTIRDLLEGTRFDFTDLGAHELKGLPHPIGVSTVTH